MVKPRTMLINAMRGPAAEFGVTAANGPKQVGERRRRLADNAAVPALAREMISVLAAQLDAVQAKLTAIEARLMAWHRQNQTSQCLATIPGIGPIGGVSFALSFALRVPDPKAFGSARHPGLRQGRLLRRGSASRRARTRPAANSGSAQSAARVTRVCAGGWCSAPPR